MKILMVNNSGALQGGAETMLAVLKRELESRGHQVRILTGDERIGGVRISDATFKTFTARSPLRIFYVFNPFACRALRRELRHFRPDIVHLHNASKASPFILALLKNQPTVLTVHDHTWFDPTRIQDIPQMQGFQAAFADYFLSAPGLRFYLERFRFRCLRRLSHNIDATLCCSNFYAACAQSSGILPHITTLHNGIELKPPLPFASGKYILFAGRLSQDKGAHIFLEAAALLRHRHPDAVFSIAGTGEQSNQLRRIVTSLEIENQVELLGHRSPEEMQKLYARAAMVVVPSLHPDNLPTVCLEAMAAGKPVLGSRIGGIPELVDDGATGLLLPPGDALSLSRGIGKLLDDVALCRRMGEAGRRKAEREFGIARYVQRTIATYQNLIQKYENPNH